MVYLRLIILCCCFSVFSSKSQVQFYKQFSGPGYDQAHGVAELLDGSFLVCGSSSSFQNAPTDAFVLKLSKLGEFLWSSHYGGAESDVAKRIFQFANRIYIIGHSNSLNGKFNVFMTKLDTLGNELEQYVISESGYEFVSDVVLDQTNKFLICGKSTAASSGDFDQLLMSIDTLGNVLWKKHLGSTGDDEFNSIHHDKDSIYYVVGGQYVLDSLQIKGVVTKFTQSGTILYHEVMPGIGSISYSDLYLKADTCYVVGSQQLNSPHRVFGYGARVASGVLVDEPLGPGESETYFDQVVLYGDQQNCYIASHYANQYSTAGSIDMGITRFTNGLIWNTLFVAVYSSFTEQNHELLATQDGGAIAVGYREDLTFGGSMIYVLKIGPGDNFPIVTMQGSESIVAVQENVQETPLLFPVPSKDFIFYPVSDPLDLEVYSVVGEKMQQPDVMNSKLDISYLPSGLYILHDGNRTYRFVRE
jgi:hypothetical protein